MKLFLEGMRNMGAIFTLGNKLWDQNISYTYHMLFEWMVNFNKVTTICLNKQRIRSGKIQMPQKPEESVEWILRAY